VSAKDATDVVRDFYLSDAPSEIRDLITMAGWDLWFGPFSEEDFAQECPDRTTRWPGFPAAVERIARWAENLPHTVWVSEDLSCVFDCQPGDEEVCDECDGNGCDYCDHVGRVASHEILWVVATRAACLGELVEYAWSK